MRFRSLTLAAYGPFANKRLDFGAGPGGLHVIFGKNEAGKSTALRAVSGLLYGMGERTQDAHVYPTKELRVAAEIESGSATLRFQRLKRRKDSLRDENDTPLPETALLPFLGGVDRSLYHTLFSLNHEQLKAGGQALLRGEGDVGKSLFDAGTGGRGIHYILRDLEQRADALFKERGKKPLLNAAISRHKEAKRALREAVRPPEMYLEQKRRLDDTQKRRDEVMTRLAEMRRERDRLKRVLKTLKEVRRRVELVEELAELGEVPELPRGLRERRLAASETLAQCARDRERLLRAIDQCEASLSGLPSESSLLSLGERAVGELGQRVGIHRKAAHDVPKIRGAIKQEEIELGRVLRQLGHPPDLEIAEGLRLDTLSLARIRRLAREREGLVERATFAHKRISQLNRECRSVREELDGLDSSTVGSMLERKLGSLGRALGGVEELSALRRREQDLSGELALALTRLELQGSVRELAPLVPEPESIQTHQAALAAAEAGWKLLDAELKQLERDSAQAQRQVDAIERQGTPPSEQELQIARLSRQMLWNELKARLIGGEPADTHRVQGLVQGYETEQQLADDLADRLRREASRVAQLAEASAERDALAQRLDEVSAERDSAKVALADQERRWTLLFKDVPVTLRSPLEMLGWRQRFDAACRLEADLEGVRRELYEQQATQDRAAAELRAMLGEAESSRPLPDLLAEAERLVEEHRKLARAHLGLETKAAELERQLGVETKAAEELDAEKLEQAERFTGAIRCLKLGDLPSSDEVLDALDQIEDLSHKLDSLADKRRRVHGIERDAANFQSDLEPLLREHAADLLELPVDDAAEELANRFAVARQHQQERLRLQTELAALHAELEDGDRRARAGEDELTELCTVLEVPDVAQLEAVERRAEAAREKREEVAKLDDYLLVHGVGVEVLVEEARQWDRARAIAAIDDLEEQCDEAEERLRELDGELQSLEAGLGYYGDEAAASARQRVEERAAEVHQHLDGYLTVHLAKYVLTRQIAAHREAYQGPVLSRAGELFKMLTLGSFVGLRAGLEADELCALREGGEELSVAGLSEGTQYQLYLALRLATLDEYLKTAEPLPLVLDDLLIHFDEERAGAAFQVLGEFAERVQILYFTHLSRDFALSNSAANAGVLRQHRLSPEGSGDRAAWCTPGADLAGGAVKRPAR